ncbi:MBL fold metallo-hydrolase [Deinococcus oregonensis]|uniref:MBL fold metallo-hydrolase n=1 Tax=Deinococcus oregonensis TaxID=1805970 RepID=A0ABV6B4X5_9DEIO
MNNAHFGRVSGDVYALAVWDKGWQSYTNSYLILRDQQVMLIDTGKAEHFPQLQAALETLGKTADDVTVVLATHGHADHIGSVGRFPKAVNALHPHDFPLLSPADRAHFTLQLPDQGEVFGLTCWLWGDHTAGSCVLHDPASGVTFAGDPLCFFGEPLPEGALVARADALRDALVSWVGQGELYRDPRVQPERFRRGLAYLSTLDMSYLATGHGVILCGNLPAFFQALRAKA